MKNDFQLQYENILLMNLAPIEYFEDFIGFEPLSDEVGKYINNIFDMMFKFKHNKFYNDTDIKIAYKLIYNDIWRLNDTLYQLNSLPLANLIYEIIWNIFEEIAVLCLDFEKYEMLKNFTNIKYYWFDDVNVEIIIEGEQR